MRFIIGIMDNDWCTFLSHQEPSAFFWIDQGGLEVDLVIKADGQFWWIEITLIFTPRVNHRKVLNSFKALAAHEAGNRHVLQC
jgi:hypothetical protein